MQKIDYEELAKREVIKEIKRFIKRFILEMDLLSGEEKRRIVEEIDKIIEQIKEDKFYKRKAVEEIQEQYYVSKDKIKAKIEELEKQDRENRMSHNYLVIPVLQSLLEKE